MLSRCMILVAFTLSACLFSGSSSKSDSGPLGGSLTVNGQVVDFQTGAAITGTASVTTEGLKPAPKVTSQGAGFTIDGIPENSAFQILASAPPTYHATFSQTVNVTDSGVDGVKAPAVSEAFLTSLATAFQQTPSTTKGILFIQLLDAAGKPRAGVTAANLAITGASKPFFLDANMMPAPAATASSSSGWVVFFAVPEGTVSPAAPAGATVTLDMASSPLFAGTVTLADAKVTDGAPTALPTNVSFANQVVPIFTKRGCVACHSGNGPGKALGGLMLDGGTPAVYKNLVTNSPGTIVNLAMPEKSLVLTMPSYENPPDAHPNVTFTGPTDKDYVTLLVWIREGAKQN